VLRAAHSHFVAAATKPRENRERIRRQFDANFPGCVKGRFDATRTVVIPANAEIQCAAASRFILAATEDRVAR
jgi:hypothetical protein